MTYLPKEQQEGKQIGLIDLLQKILDLWESEEKEKLLIHADRVLKEMKEVAFYKESKEPSYQDLSLAVELLLEEADPVFGGFRGTPKFPLSYVGDFLLSYSFLYKESRALFFWEMTLQKMYEGAIFDHLEGGFARYAVDERWRIPHFEKMLCDNALLACSYCDAWLCLKDPLYRKVSIKTLDYVLKNLQLQEGGFASGEDADVAGEEGGNSLWSFQELEELLTQEQFHVFSHVYGVTREGNYHGKNTLYLSESIEEAQENSGIEKESFFQLLQEATDKVLLARSLKGRPARNDQVLVSWNALTVEALLKAGLVFHKEEYVQAAEQGLLFLQKQCVKEGSLQHCWQAGKARFDATIDDYAYLIKACLSFFEAGLGSQWLPWALSLQETLDQTLQREDGLYAFAKSKEMPWSERCELYDASEPCGSSVQAGNLVKLYRITGKESFLTRSQKLFQQMSPLFSSCPTSSCYGLASFFSLIDEKAPTLVIALDEKQTGKEEITQALYETYSPHRTVLWKFVGDLALFSPLEKKDPIEGKTTLYVCYPGRLASYHCGLMEILQALRNL